MYRLFKNLSIFTIIILGVVNQSFSREYFNDKEVPETIEDVKAIEASLLKHLERCRTATVCIKAGEGSGSGVIVREDGLVMTAAHVTGATNTEMTVIREDGTELKAISLGLDSNSDAGLLKIVTPGKYPFVNVEKNTLNNITTKLGDWVFSIGHSGGFDEDRGSVVRLGRIVRMTDSPPTFQSDCSLIGGDSGGPLFNMDGILIGIHSRVGKVLDQNMHVMSADFFGTVEEDDKLTKWERMLEGDFIGDGPFAKKPIPGSAFMGVNFEETTDGLKVIDIEEKGVADKAGVKLNDVLVKLNDKPYKTKKELREYMKTQVRGGEVSIEIKRGDENLTIEFKFGKR